MSPLTNYGRPHTRMAGCPRVYLYTRDNVLKNYKTLQNDIMYESLKSPYLSLSNQHAGGSLLIHWSYTGNPCVTYNPNDADFFIVPMIPPKERQATESEMKVKVHTFMPMTSIESFQVICDELLNEAWTRAYPQLTGRTARRHILAFSRMNEVPNVCQTIDETFMQKLKQSGNYQYYRHMIRTKGAQVNSLQESYMSLPMVSNIRYPCSYVRTNQTMWQHASTTKRPYLMSFGGSTYGMEMSVHIRKKVVQDCASYGEPWCIYKVCNNDDATGCQMSSKHAIELAMENKRNSVFCIEPPGFGFERAAIVDALLSGCIPVLFTPREDELIWPVHWGPWRENSRILLSGRDYLDGKINLLTTLRGISADRIRQMQTTIETHAHRMHYALDDCPGDAIYTFLHNLKSTFPTNSRWHVHKNWTTFRRELKAHRSRLELQA